MSIENRGNNKFRFRIRKDGINYTQNFYGTEKEAEKEHKKFEVDVMREQIGYNENMRFSELAQLMLDENIRQNSKENTELGYINAFNNHLLDYFGEMKIGKIKKIHIQKFINDEKNNFATLSVKKYVANLNATFNFAISFNIIKENPCTGVKLPKENYKSYNELLSSEELKKLFMIIENESDLQFRCIYLLGLCMGMRKGEILALTIKDIDFESNTININKQLILHIDNKKHTFIIGEPKTNNSYRKIYMTDIVKKELKKYIDNLNIINIEQEKQYIFINPETQKIYAPSTVNYRLKALLEKKQIETYKISRFKTSACNYAHKQWSKHSFSI